MSSTSHSITWRSWSQRWGDWTTWLQKLDVPRELDPRGLALRTQSSNEAIQQLEQVKAKAVAAHRA